MELFMLTMASIVVGACFAGIALLTIGASSIIPAFLVGVCLTMFYASQNKR
jgi:Flp pilus assembly protein TadB